MKRRDFLKIVSYAGLACVLARCRPHRLRIGDIAPDLKVVDLNGKQLTLPGDLKGKVVLLHFWASWCTSCIDEMRDNQSLYVDYESRGVTLCSVSIGDTKAAIEAYLKNVKVSYPVLIDERGVSKRLYSISGVPTTYVLDRDGVVKFVLQGPYRRNVKEGMVKSLLGP